MLLKLFKGTGPGVIILVVVTLLVVWINTFFNPAMKIVSVNEMNNDPMPLYALLENLVAGNYLYGTFFSLAMVSMLVFLLVNFNTTVFFINERTFLPAVIFILFGGLFPQNQLLSPVLPASLFLMLAIIRIIDGYRKPDALSNFFDAAILISSGSLFYANLIWFGLLVIIGIALLRTGNILEIAISVFGLITPYLITFGLYYVLGRDIQISLSTVENNLFGSADPYVFSRVTIVTLIFTGMIVILCMAFLFMGLNTKKIKARKTFYLLFWVFCIGLGVYFIMPSASVEIVWIIGIPVSYFLTHYFIFSKNKVIPEILFSVLFCLILLIQIWYLNEGII